MSKYVRQWQDYRRRRNLFLFAYIGWLPLAVVFILVAILLFGDKPHYDKPVGAIAICCWMAFFVFASMRFSGFRCPRCGNKFFIQRRLMFSSYSMFATKCVHCDLPKYAGGEKSGYPSS